MRRWLLKQDSHKKVPDADLATTSKWVEEYLRPEQRVPGNVGYVIREIETGSESESSGAVKGGDGDGKGEFDFGFTCLVLGVCVYLCVGGD